MSREMAHKVILPPKKNYIKKFLKQRDIGIFMYQSAVVYCTVLYSTDEEKHSTGEV